MQLLVDFQNSMTHGLSLPSKAITANTNGGGIDFQNADIRTHMVVSLGTNTNTGNFSVKAQESDDNTTFADAADTNANTGNFTNANANTSIVKSFTRTKRYLRLVATLTTAGDGQVIAGTIFAQKKYDASNNAGYSIAPGV